MNKITTDNFEEFIKNDLVLIDVFAEWCGPCKAMNPVLELVSKELNGKLVVGKINADNDLALAQKLGVRGIPAFFLYQKGNLVEKWTGQSSKSSLIDKISKYL